MNETIELEVFSPIYAQLVEYAGKTGLEQTSTTPLVEAFRPVFVEAKKAIADSAGVAESVKDATCVSEIRRARACRLAIRKVRLTGEAVRKAQKATALAYGKAVDGFYNILEADLAPVEKALQDAEDTAERAEQARKDALESGRKAALTPYVTDVSLYAVRDMSEPAFAALLAGVKLAHEQAARAAAKAEADRIAKEKAEAAERERIRAENERLQREAKEKEEALRQERLREQAAREVERLKAEAVLKAEREAAEKKLAAERAEAQRVAAELKAKADAEAKAAKEKADKERAIIEAKAKAEREARQKVESELKAQRDAEVARQAAEEAAARKAANAGDSEKLIAYAKTIREALPNLKNTERMNLIGSQAGKFVAWIEKEAANGN
jgi:hypothetical protein